jgi:sugar (pentulose or hexulose) kinase
VKTLFRVLRLCVQRLVCAILSLFIRRRPSRVALGSWSGVRFVDNSRYLAEYLAKNRPDLTLYWVGEAHLEKEVKAALRDTGAPEPESLSDILRAVTMGLAVCYDKSIKEMAEITGKQFTSINIVGGGSANVVLNQMTADVTGLPVYAGPTEGTALGNLAAQMIVDGAFADLAAFRAALPGSFEIKEYLPKA